jgi:hypothetical protein
LRVSRERERARASERAGECVNNVYTFMTKCVEKQQTVRTTGSSYFCHVECIHFGSDRFFGWKPWVSSWCVL